MDFPLSVWDISMLFAFAAIVLLLTSELLTTYHGKINLKINRKRLRSSAVVFSSLFLVTVGMKIAETILNM